MAVILLLLMMAAVAVYISDTAWWPNAALARAERQMRLQKRLHAEARLLNLYSASDEAVKRIKADMGAELLHAKGRVMYYNDEINALQREYGNGVRPGWISAEMERIYASKSHWEAKVKELENV